LNIFSKINIYSQQINKLLNNNYSTFYCREGLEIDDIDLGNRALYFNYVRCDYSK